MAVVIFKLPCGRDQTFANFTIDEIVFGAELHSDDSDNVKYS